MSFGGGSRDAGDPVHAVFIVNNIHTRTTTLCVRRQYLHDLRARAKEGGLGVGRAPTWRHV